MPLPTHRCASPATGMKRWQTGSARHDACRACSVGTPRHLLCMASCGMAAAGWAKHGYTTLAPSGPAQQHAHSPCLPQGPPPSISLGTGVQLKRPAHKPPQLLKYTVKDVPPAAVCAFLGFQVGVHRGGRAPGRPQHCLEPAFVHRGSGWHLNPALCLAYAALPDNAWGHSGHPLPAGACVSGSPAFPAPFPARPCLNVMLGMPVWSAGCLPAHALTCRCAHQ